MRFHSFLAVLVISPLTLADIVRLNDGTTINGDIKKAADGWYVTDAHGKVTHVSTDQVKSIELAPKGDPKDVAVGKLASLRRSVEALSDLKLIIDRYEKFIEQNKDLPNVVEDGKKDLALWKARQARGMVKVGTKWVDAAEKAQMQQMAAMNLYLQAMQAMPLNKELLNNVAEALNGLTPEQRKSPIAQKVYKLWTEQDNQLQQQMMPLGWYRWGATWVDKGQFEKLQAAEKEVKEKIAKMEEDFADAQAKVDTIDS